MALEIDPTNEEIRRNYKLFLDGEGGNGRATPGWEKGPLRGMEEPFVWDEEVRLAEGLSGDERVQAVLLAG